MKGGQLEYYSVPSSVHMDDGIADTPRTGNQRSIKSSDGDGYRAPKGGEVDAYENPTELFQWINYGNYKSAAAHVLEHPSEAKTWIVSRKRGKNGEYTVKWKYLPLHLACMKSNPSEDLLRALTYANPSAARERDYDGNLPIHYLLSEGCDHNSIIEMLLRANPESIDKRDRKGRNLLEIISEGYRSGKLKKDTMVNMLAILRQWTVTEDRNFSGNTPFAQRHELRGGNEETREAPPSETTSRSAFTFEDIDDNRRSRQNSRRFKRSKSTGHRRSENSEIFRVPLNDTRDYDDDDFKISFDDKGDKMLTREVLEGRLENTLTERDILRKTVSKLKAEAKNQDMALSSLHKELENAALEQQKSKDKLRKRKERIEELQQQLKEQRDRFENREKMIYDKEQKLSVKNMQLRELNDRIEKLVEENSRLRGGLDGGSTMLSTRLEQTEEENQNLRTRVNELLKSKADALKAAENKNQELIQQIQELEEHFEHEHGDKRDDSLLKSRIKTLERELLEFSRGNNDGNFFRPQDTSIIENERNALKEMNASLQEHVGALKERCRHLEEAVTDRKELQQNVQRLESDLLHSRLKQSEYHEQMEHARSESLINESRLQTQVAKLERELLETRGAHETETHGSTGVDDEKHLDERRALETMNSSLKEHITALMAKCSALEKSLTEAREKNAKFNEARFGDMGGRSNMDIELAELREKNAALMEELHAARFDDIGERQKELHSEFNNLFNLVQGIANAGSGSEHAKNLVAMQMENNSLRKETASIKARFAEAQLQIEQLETELLDVRSSHLPSKAVHDTKNENLRYGRNQIDRIIHGEKASNADTINELETQLREITRQADFYKEQFDNLKEKYEMAKSSNGNLREIITKNNGTYMARVELLTEELEHLRQANESLHAHIHDLSVENRVMRNDFTTNSREERPGQIEELADRLNNVAAYLIAISQLLDEDHGDSELIKTEHGQQSDSNKEMLRREIEMCRNVLLESEDRNDIVQRANHLELELMQGSHRPQAKYLTNQRDELKSISAELQNLSHVQK